MGTEEKTRTTANMLTLSHSFTGRGTEAWRARLGEWRTQYVLFGGTNTARDCKVDQQLPVPMGSPRLEGAPIFLFAQALLREKNLLSAGGRDCMLPGGDLPGIRETMLVMVSGLCDRGVPGSLDESGVEADAEGGQLMTAVVAASAERGLVWMSLGRWTASAGTVSGAMGAVTAGKKFSRLSLGCLGVVGVSPEAC